MKVISSSLEFRSKGENDMIDMTEKIQEVVKKQSPSNGVVVVFVVGSTAAITIMEYEPGLLKDFPHMLERIAPKQLPYEHQKTWHDDNGHSHVKSSLVGVSLTIPLVEGKLALGTWQQVVFLELDTRPRLRKVLVQLMCE